MNTDRELLELAAKAAGLHIDKSTTNGGGMRNTGFDMLGNAMLDWHNNVRWNPLTDDGDALRLAVKLNIHLEFAGRPCAPVDRVQASPKGFGHLAYVAMYGGDPCAATRRAIVCAAAEIGKAMP